MPKKDRPTVLSFFSGCGGLDLGFKQANFNLVGAYDNDASAVACYNENIADHAEQVDVRSLSETTPMADVFLAGPPCQGFSNASGIVGHDERNDLLTYISDFFSELGPKIIVIENVAALTNRRNLGYLQSVLATLSSRGYYCDVETLNSYHFGVPQQRKRVFIVARKGQKPFQLRSILKKCNPMTVGNAIGNIPQNVSNHTPKYLKNGSRVWKVARRISPGHKLCNVRGGNFSVTTWAIPEVFGAVSSKEIEVLETIRKLRRVIRRRDFGDSDPVSLSDVNKALNRECFVDIKCLVGKKYLRTIGSYFDLTNTFNGKYRRLDLNAPSPTVDTRFGEAQLFLHPIEDRSMTVREAARLQSFPDDFVFPEDNRAAFRMIGNAVPPMMSFAVANAVRELLK